jgi:hypothetical protein
LKTNDKFSLKSDYLGHNDRRCGQNLRILLEWVLCEENCHECQIDETTFENGTTDPSPWRSLAPVPADQPEAGLLLKRVLQDACSGSCRKRSSSVRSRGAI